VEGGVPPVEPPATPLAETPAAPVAEAPASPAEAPVPPVGAPGNAAPTDSPAIPAAAPAAIVSPAPEVAAEPEVPADSSGTLPVDVGGAVPTPDASAAALPDAFDVEPAAAVTGRLASEVEDLEGSLAPVGPLATPPRVVEDLGGSLPPVVENVGRSPTPVSPDLGGALAPVSPGLRDSLSPVGPDLGGSLSPVNPELGGSLPPVSPDLGGSLSPAAPDLAGSVPPVHPDLGGSPPLPSTPGAFVPTAVVLPLGGDKSDPSAPPAAGANVMAPGGEAGQLELPVAAPLSVVLAPVVHVGPGGDPGAHAPLASVAAHGEMPASAGAAQANLFDDALAAGGMWPSAAAAAPDPSASQIGGFGAPRLPASSGGGAATGVGLAFTTLLALLIALASFTLQRFERLRLVPAVWRQQAFVAVIERPG